MGGRTIIVGAGSAGAVVAHRMTEAATHDVLLLEAGPDYPNSEALPGDLADGTRNSMTAHDWGLSHLPSPTLPSMPFPRGRVVGGSSAVNTCIALRGQPYDYDEWAARGLAEWSWERCLPAFKRLESDLDVQNEHHGERGPLPLRRHPPEELVPFQAAFLDGCESLGFDRCDDHNHPTSTGAGPHVMNKLEGRRVSAATAYLAPDVRRRPSLTIRAERLVHRVLFKGKRVVGVEASHGGRLERHEASQVVLSAGAVCTPGILLRSGVGPREVLRRLGVARVATNDGVGVRLLDHPGAAIFLLPREGVCRVGDPLIQTTLRYAAEDGGRPNEMQLQPGSFLPTPWFDLPLLSLMCCVGKPRGVGSIVHASADPRARPILESDFFRDPDDLEKAAEALELAMLVATSEPMRDLARFLVPREGRLSSRRALRDYIRGMNGSGYHPAGTAPMGTDDDRHAAVDSRGRVRGVEGLIVADASIMPTIPSANTNLATLMIGERIGAWLRDGDIDH